MEQRMHSMSNLFAQLGQASDEAGIARFIAANHPLAGDVGLHEAAFWNQLDCVCTPRALASPEIVCSDHDRTDDQRKRDFD
jgi:hypothetical protein